MLGFPCNQFLGQEPGTPDEIKTFCETNYGVTFPLFEKIEVNGDGRHALYEQLVEVPDSADGHTGDIRWNFEKFLVSPSGEIVGRFSPTVEPEDPALVERHQGPAPRAESRLRPGRRYPGRTRSGIGPARRRFSTDRVIL